MVEPMPGPTNLQRLAQIFPRTRKQRYLLAMSEDDFRDKVVRPIFLQQGYIDGRETCGPSEEGKDCYFTKTAELSGTDIVVVQTKKGKITMASVPRDNLESLVTQLRTALNTSVDLVSEKRRLQPIVAYLVASGEINQRARSHIVEAIKDPRLKFIDVEMLIPLIDKHMPEFWLNIETNVVSYLQALCRAIETGGQLIHTGILVGYENANGAVLDDAYTNINVVSVRPRRPLRGAKLAKKGSRRGDLEPSFPITSIVSKKDSLILVVGEGGSGKSTALKRIAYDLARRPIESPTDVRIPILMRARDLLDRAPESLWEQAIDRVRAVSPDFKQPFGMEDLSTGRVIFLIDALDEIAAEKQAEIVIDLVLDFHERFPNCKVILTSRPTPYIRSSSRVGTFSPYRITNFSLMQARKIIKALAKQKSLSSEDSSEILRRLQEVHGVSLSPLIVTIFVASSDISKQDIPPNITELFKKYTELMLGRWDEGKQLHQQIQAPVKDLVLQQVAMRMHSHRVTSLPIEEFKRLVYSELGTRGFLEETAVLYEEIIERSELFRVDSDRIEFRHLLFQEFFAGRAIPNAEFIYQVVHEDWWKRAIVFYFGEHPNDIVSLEKMVDTIKKRSPGEAFVAATTIGLALQACYFALLEDKEKIYEAVVRALIDARGDKRFAPSFEGMPTVVLVLSAWMARESLALSNLKIFADRIEKRLVAAYRGDDEKNDEIRFWLILGLLESGFFKLAQEMAKEFRPRDPALLLALRFEALVAAEARVVADSGREELKDLVEVVTARLRPSAEVVRKQLEREVRMIEADFKKSQRGNADAPEGG